MVVKLPLTGTLILVTLTSGTVKMAVITKLRAGPVQVALFAETLMDPELASTLMVIALVIETPVHTPGIVQV